jgi:hypothetical protein
MAFKARLSRNFDMKYGSDTVDVELNVPLNIGDTFFSTVVQDDKVNEYEGKIVKVHHFIHFDIKNNVIDHRPMYTLQMNYIRTLMQKV